MTKRKKILSIIAIAIAVVAVGWKGFGLFMQWKYSHMGMGNMAMPVNAATLTPEKLEEHIRAIGTFNADESADIRSEIPGRITVVSFTEGQQVKKGDVLLQIDDSIYRSELVQAEANLELSRLTYERTKELQKKGAASTQLRDETVAQLKEMEASVELAKTRLEKTNIRAPFDGLIGLREFGEGDYVDTGSIITHIEAVNPMKVEFSIPEKYFSYLMVDLPLDITVDAYPGKTFHGKIFAIDSRVDVDTRTIRVKALLPNADGTLRPGMFAYLGLLVTHSDDSIMVPEEALIPQGDKVFVYKVVDGKASFTEITIGSRRIGKVEVLGGLKAGDTVITAGHMKIRDGSAVTVIPATPQKPKE